MHDLLPQRRGRKIRPETTPKADKKCGRANAHSNNTSLEKKKATWISQSYRVIFNMHTFRHIADRLAGRPVLGCWAFQGPRKCVCSCFKQLLVVRI